MAKLSGSLPKGHGLNPAIRRLSQGDPVVGLVVLRRMKRVEDYEKGETELVVKISEIEAIHTEDLYLARRLMERALEARTGQPVLPYDLEAALEGVFDGVDLDYPQGSPVAQEPLPKAAPPTFCKYCREAIHYEQVEGDLWRWTDDGDPDCSGNPEGHEAS